MNKPTLRRERFQAGSLKIAARKSGPDVYVFRWRDNSIKRKVILGTVKELSKTQAQKKADEYRQLANTPQPTGTNTSITVAELVEHYKERELGDDSGKAAKPRKAYLYIFNNYILSKWGSLPLGQVKAVAVEDC
jgi:integrase